MRYGNLCRTKMFAQDKESQIYNCILGVAGEAGEIADYYKKILFHPSSKLTKEDLRKEMGDLLWYLSVLNEIEFGDSLVDVAKDNLRKLIVRYPSLYDLAELDGLTL